METYCGKNCEACTYKEALSCSGCQSGPGRVLSGECKLARCCRDKGHEACETCGHKRNCGIWLDKGSIPKQRMERQQEKQEEAELLKRRAPLLGKWLTLMFWLVVPRISANFLTNETMVNTFPALEQPGKIVLVLCSIIYAIALFRISKEHKFYSIAGMLYVGIIAIDVIFFALNSSSMGINLFLAVVQIVVMLISDYYEYKAHAEMVLSIDGNISEQWDTLWNWQLYSHIGLAVGMFLLVLIPFVGVLLMLASAIGLIVAGVKKLICLYRTSKAFSENAESFGM